MSCMNMIVLKTMRSYKKKTPDLYHATKEDLWQNPFAVGSVTVRKRLITANEQTGLNT